MDNKKKQGNKNHPWWLLVGWIVFAAAMCLLLIFLSPKTGKSGNTDNSSHKDYKEYELKEDVFFIEETYVGDIFDPDTRIREVSTLFYLPEGMKFQDNLEVITLRRTSINQVDIVKSEIYHNEPDGTKRKLSEKEKIEWLFLMAEKTWIEPTPLSIDHEPELSLTKSVSNYVFSGEYEGTFYVEKVDDVCELTVQYAREKRWTGFKVMIAVSIYVSVLICISMMKKKIKMAAGSVGVGAAILICVFAFVMV